MTQFQRYSVGSWVDDDGCVVAPPAEMTPHERQPAAGVILSKVLLTVAIASMFSGAVEEVRSPSRETAVAEAAIAQRASAESGSALIRGRVRRLADEWARRNLFVSSTHQRTSDPAFREIVTLGEPAVPYLIELLDQVGDWDLALKEITGEDPAGQVTADGRKAIARAWRAWASERVIGWQRVTI